MSGLSTGIVIGVATAVVIWLLRFAIGRILSLIQRILQQGHNVSGTWRAEYSKDGQHLTEVATFRQFLHWVWGVIDNQNVGRKYKVRGSVRVNVLVATYEFKGKRNQIDRGAFTLLLNLEGDKMSGHYSWTDISANEPRSGTYEWRRVGSDAQ